MFEAKPKIANAAIRVSSIKQGVEGDSPEAQKEQIQRYAKARNITIKNYFKFHESASGEAQPLQEVIDYYKKPSNHTDLLIIKSIDRLTRKGTYAYGDLKMQLDKYNVQLLDVYGVINPQRVNTLEHLGFSYDWSVYSPSIKSEMLEAERASDEKRDIMSRLIGAEIRYAQLGYWVRRPPYGFTSRSVMTAHGRRSVLIPHPRQAAYVIKAFELRARGTLTDQEIVDVLNSLGYKSRTQYQRSKTDKMRIIGTTGGVSMTLKQLAMLIANPLYAGVNCEKWTNGKPVKCRFKGLVSPELFNRANKGKVAISDDRHSITYEKTQNQTIVTPKSQNYPYRRVVLCPVCEKPFLGSASKGKSGAYFPAYHCSRTHASFRVPKAKFEATIEEFISRIKISPEYVEPLLKIFAEEWEKRNEAYYQDIDLKREHLEEIKNQIRNLVNNMRFMSSSTGIEYLQNDLEELESEKRQLKQQINSMSHNRDLISDTAKRKAHSYVSDIPSLLVDDNSSKIEAQLFGVIFDSLPSYEDLINQGSEDCQRLNALFKESYEVQ